MTATKTIGTELQEKGIKASARYLASRGYEVLETSWSCSAGEVDIIALEDDVIAFIEVKTRMVTDEEGYPQEGNNASKRERFEKIALAYLRTTDFIDRAVRFDVITVLALGADKASIRHHKAAFCNDDNVIYTLSDDLIDKIKSEFHLQLRNISYDVSGSTADMVENCLAKALNEIQNNQ